MGSELSSLATTISARSFGAPAMTNLAISRQMRIRGDWLRAHALLAEARSFALLSPVICRLDFHQASEAAGEAGRAGVAKEKSNSRNLLVGFGQQAASDGEPDFGDDFAMAGSMRCKVPLKRASANPQFACNILKRCATLQRCCDGFSHSMLGGDLPELHRLVAKGRNFRVSIHSARHLMIDRMARLAIARQNWTNAEFL